MREVLQITSTKRKSAVKRAILLAIFSCLIIFSVCTSAGAKYAGAELIGGTATSDPLVKRPGFLDWSKAVNLMTADATITAATEGLRSTPHGGYTIATTKCSVCHSVHRSTATPAYNGGNNYITGAANACAACHTTWGGGSSTKQVEWGDPAVGPTGPHEVNGTENPCRWCHAVGVHGTGAASAYWGMNYYMLGNPLNDYPLSLNSALPESGVTDLTGGNYTPDSDARIAFELGGFVGGVFTPKGNYSESQNRKFVDGTSGSGPILTSLAGLKSNAAGYTCARQGCHIHSVFTINKWGFGAQRDYNNKGDLKTFTGHRTILGSGDQPIAGNSPAYDIGGTQYCGPCHPGKGAGGYRAATNAPVSTYSHGCDQCHDLVGVATNSTAWPHANRNVYYYEWDYAGAAYSGQVTTARNLWMYAGSVATVKSGDMNTDAPAIDKSFRLIKNAVGSGEPVSNGIVNDGACLKCHVAVDEMSIKAVSAVNVANGGDPITAMFAPWHANTTPGQETSIPTDPSEPTTLDPINFRYIYLWR